MGFSSLSPGYLPLFLQSVIVFVFLLADTISSLSCHMTQRHAVKIWGFVTHQTNCAPGCVPEPLVTVFCNCQPQLILLDFIVYITREFCPDISTVLCFLRCARKTFSSF